MARNKKKITPFMKYLGIVLFLITSLALSLFKFINVLPDKYLLVLVILLLFFVLLFFIFIFSKKYKKRIIGSVLAIFYIIVLIIAILYELNTIDFLKRLGFKNYKTENYSVLVLKDSEYEKISDLNQKKLGSLTFISEGLKNAKNKIEHKVSLEFITYEEISKLKNSFLNKEIEAMLIEKSILSILNKED